MNNSLIKNSLNNTISYTAYRNLVKTLIAKNKSTGIGQSEELSLEREEQYYRINNFIDCLKEHNDSV
ncbi:MAG: hypothetical protein P1P79_08105, partial [Lutibacter sp.]|nr:hypothetical protein [Lutibacter sp.]